MTSILSNFISPEKEDEHLRQVPLTRVLSREKEACEFYQERKALDEGDLPALIRGALKHVTTQITAPAEANSNSVAVVTPSGETNHNKNIRSITPHRGNRQSDKKGKSSSSLGFKRGRRKEQQEPDTIKKDLFGKVAVNSPRKLSPNSKRKHRVFWTQLDLDDVEDGDEDAVPKGKSTMKSNEKVVKKRSFPVQTTAVTTVEVEEKNEPRMVDGLLNAVNTCLDCGWIGSAITAGSNTTTVETQSRAIGSSTTQPPFFQNRALVADTDDNSTDISDTDTQTMKSNSQVSRQVQRSNGYENTAIEVEFMNEDDVPDDEDEERNHKSSQGFVQLNTSGEVTQFVSNTASENQDHLRAYDLTKSHTWGEKEKSAYIQAMTKRAKDEFKRKKGIVDEDESLNRTDSVNYITRDNTPLKPSLVRSRSMEYVSAGKSVGFSPLGVIDFADEKIVVPSVKRLNENPEAQLSESMKLRQTGSVLSHGRRKKKGDFQQLDDDGVDIEDSNKNNSPPAPNLERKEKSLPHTDVFDFKDVSENSAPMSSVKLDPYEDSCDVSLLGSLNVGGDGASVVSGKSLYTTGTHATNWSTSTRRRHRGAAKNRKVDLDNQRPVGWLESIKAAAASNNRKWDPKHGWVDYTDEEEEIEIQKIGKLKPLLNAKKTASGENSDGARTNSHKVSVPFPSEWEKDRDDMISLASHESEMNTNITENNQKSVMRPSATPQDVIEEASDEEEREDLPKSLENSPIQRLKKKSVEVPTPSNVEHPHSNMSFSSEHVEKSSFEVRDLSRPSVLDWIGRCQSSDIVKDAAIGGGDIIKEAMPKFRGAINDALRDQKTKLSSSVKVYDEIQEDDDFDGNNSFDFETSGEEMNHSNEDGFKVIESSTIKKFDDGMRERSITPNFEKEQESLNRLRSLKFPIELESDRSVVSTASSVAAKAIDWRKKVEMKKMESRSKSSTIPENSTLFISAGDDSSTFEISKNSVIVHDHEPKATSPKIGPLKSYVRKDAEHAAPPFQISERPKKTDVHNDSMSEVTSLSEASSFVPRAKNESFLSRLQACTGPMFEKDDMPMAHLAFLKNSASKTSPIRSYRNVPFCGNPNNVDGDDSSETVSSKMKKPSVAASYLQALKDKSKSAAFIPKEPPLAKTSSDVSAGSGKSESWNRFLEKRNQALASSSKRSGSSIASEDPTSFAKKTVQEIINKISTEHSQDNLAKTLRSSSTLPLRPPSIGVIPRSLSAGKQRVSLSNADMMQFDAVRAAEELAAAKVEAMMLTQKFGKEGEI